MSEVSDGINQLFSAGLTREAFIEKYKQLQESEINVSEESIFAKDLSETLIGAMYDSFHQANTTDYAQNVTTDKDIRVLAGYDGDTTSISEEDLMHLYQQSLEKFQNAEISYDSLIDDSDNAIYPNEALDMLSLMRVAKIKLANIEKANIQNEIDSLVINSKGIAKELQNEYNSAKQNLKTAQQNLVKKQNESRFIKEQIQSVTNTISRKHGELDGLDDEDKKENVRNEINSLAKSNDGYENKLSVVNSEISGFNSTISIAETRMNSIIVKITKNDNKTARKINTLQDKINNIDKRLEQELNEIDNRISEINTKRSEIAYNLGYETGKYISNPPKFNPDAVNFNSLSEKGLKYSSAKGQELADDIFYHKVGFTGKCSRYVRQALQRKGMHNGHTAHAYQMADVLAENSNFQEINPSDVDLKKLPAGCILVYERGARRNNGKTYSKTSGHIEITLGDGRACSDGITNNISSNDVRVFVPVEKA